ncbi:MAG TPA: M1 family metallopeptidase, partial [Thermoanaerobaculia bacterium]|nr:M1 family metallopeptidase [Thermoanaerobaculia bacterium]
SPPDPSTLDLPPVETGAAAPAGVELPAAVHQTRLVASYDPESRRIQGSEKLRWHNTASVPVDELVFHLYLNAFANNRTTFMRESGGQLRQQSMEGQDDPWGWTEVRSIRLADGTELTGQGEVIAPDDGNPFDRTVVRYPLPEPLPPGAWVEVDVEFESRLPFPFARTGARGDYVLGAQWFPKIAVFEDAGVGGRGEPGWNAHQFHAHSEFFADFGDFDVTLTLPERYRGKIGATGQLVSEQVADGQVSARFVQRGVHDFAWTADTDSLVLRETFDPEADVSPEYRRRLAETLGLPPEPASTGPVEITLFLQPAHASQAGRYFRAAKAGLRGYGSRLGAYPYDTLTLVDPQLGALGTGGMEYPTFITLATHPLLDLPPFRHVLMPEVVTVHEFGHQYFQGMIASNEFEESWIDEGINSFYERLVMAEHYGPHPVRLLGLEIPYLELQRNGGVGRGGYDDPVVAPSWRYLTGGSYGLNSYDRPALVLTHLQGLLGAPVFHAAMREFFQRYRFTHPTTADFERTIQEVSGRDLDWFFRQALHSTRSLNYAVTRLTNRRVRDDRGTFWEGGERVVRGSEAGEGGAEAAGDEAEADQEDGPRRWLSQVVVRREAEFVHPVVVEMRFDDGRVVRRTWDGEARWARFTFHGASRLVSAEVDPGGWMVLDTNRLDNSRTTETTSGPMAAIAADALWWFQGLFAALRLLA